MVNPYYEQDGITIYHGDCREIMPNISGIDLVITDPPYGIGYQSSRKIVKDKKIHGDESFPIEDIRYARHMACNGSYVFCRWDNLKDMDKPKSVLAWVKNNHTSGDLNHEHGRMWEACCFYPGPSHRFRKRTPDVLRASQAQYRHHPTEKPVHLMKQLMEANEFESVIDPFMGSGSTLRAAKDLGKRAIGIEIDERYCEIAANRLAQGVFDFSAR